LQVLFQSAQRLYDKRKGSESGSVPLTNGVGSGSGRAKNMRTLRIRIPNTGLKVLTYHSNWVGLFDPSR